MRSSNGKAKRGWTEWLGSSVLGGYTLLRIESVENGFEENGALVCSKMMTEIQLTKGLRKQRQ